MTREAIAEAFLVWVIGVIVGWVVGWVARGDENRRWAENFRRRVDRAEERARDAELELEVAHAQLERLDGVWVPAAVVPEIHVHMAAPAALGYPEVAGAAGAVVAAELSRVIEAGS